MKSMSKMAFVLAILVIGASVIRAQTDARVTDIRARVATINKDSVKYKKTKKDVVDISTEGTEATLYNEGKELKKIVAKLYGETFNGTVEFYFAGGQLIFEYDRINHYDTQIGLKKPVKVVRVEEIRSYFDNGKLFKLLNGTKEIAAGADEFVDAQKQGPKMIKAILEEGTNK